MRVKRITAVLILVLVICLCACSHSDVSGEKNDDLKIVGTVFPYCDFASAIAPSTQVSQLLPAGAECHSYEPTASDIAKVQNCDIFLRTGGEGEEWVDTILEAVDAKNIKIVSLSESVSLIAHEDGDWDEHIWTSPENAQLICAQIRDVLIEKDEENAEEYKNNAEEYILQLKELSSNIRDIVEKSAHNTLLFGDRFPFMYLARDYNIEYLSAFPGCGEDTEPDARTLTEIAKAAREQNTPVILYIEMSSTKVAQTIADETKAEMMMMHSCHNVTQEEINEGATYISLMENNLEVLKAALG